MDEKKEDTDWVLGPGMRSEDGRAEVFALDNRRTRREGERGNERVSELEAQREGNVQWKIR